MRLLSTFTTILFTLCFSVTTVLAYNTSNISENDTTNHISKKYVQISARNLSFDAIGSYPQKLLKIIRNDDTIKTVVISTFNEYDELNRNMKLKKAPYEPNRKYSMQISRFLKPTSYVNSHSKRIELIADTLFDGNEKYSLDIIKKALAFSSRITFDKKLAQALDTGQSLTIPSDDVLQSMTGTCSEATNVFLALMRHMGIPARMVVGYCYLPEKNIDGSHAWAECYIEGVGWWGVNPQNGNLAIPYFGYKLFTGLDFNDCQIKRLPDMYLRGKKPVEVISVDHDTFDCL